MKEKQKKLRRTMIGGQALLEGVMMRGKTSLAMAVRAPDNQIELHTERIKPRRKILRLPIIRGVAAFVDSLVTGTTTLMKSAEVSTPDEEMPSKTSMTISMIIGVVLAIGLFVFLPMLFSRGITAWTGYDQPAVLGVIEGVVRVLLFVLYLVLVRLMKDIKRTFMYHGAEHRTINCYEKGLELTVENVQSCSTKHNRCGTTFLFFVMVLSILIFALTNYVLGLFNNPMVETWWAKFLIRLALLPLVAGLSFELLRALAMMPDNKFTNAIRAPGLLLQKLSVATPDDSMVEVAIASFQAVLKMDEDETVECIDFFERKFADERKALCDYLEPEPQDGDWILCHVLDKKRGELDGVKLIKTGQLARAKELAERVKGGEPLSYVLGNCDFCGFTIKCDERALIPRFETEELATMAVNELGDTEGKRALDLCTGSGCIAHVLAKRTVAEVVASDVSDDALALAESNLKGLGVTLVKSDMFSEIDGEFDLIVTNPPYVKTFDIDGLQNEVRVQPRIALDGGEDGLHYYKIIANEGGAHLKKGGVLIAEVGDTQAQEVSKLFGAIGKTQIIEDMEKKERFVRCVK